MARKFGIINKMSTKFEDYNYIINGVGGIGKTTISYEIGKIVSGNDEGTFIVTCGTENTPTHIPGAFWQPAKTFNEFVEIVEEVVTNKSEYPHTKFIAIDSLDELFRMTETYVVSEWNSQCKKSGDLASIAKSISQAYKGYRKGENRVIDLILKQISKLMDAGYKMIYLGHTKTKAKEDQITGVKYEQLTCNLDNSYYNAIKDKVNLVAMCYFENQIEDIVEKKNAFTKSMDKFGTLVSKKRVMVFVDDGNAIDTKSHFEYIENKIDFGAQNFINAVHDAIEKKVANPLSHKSPEHVDMGNENVVADSVEDLPSNKIESEDIKEDLIDPDVEEAPFDVDGEVEVRKTMDERLASVREAFKSATKEIKDKVKEVLIANGDGETKAKLDTLPIEEFEKVEKILGL